ncbi:MAG: type III-B CRISPR-associated protein Cas10/Cmr2 [Saprospiraceae bacterium]|nr:type III-B CRISPR-associated protein Cas10/Cmr2 [Saprospiraceae bacterium]
MNNRYLALTIGPIGATLQNTRSTKAMWAASYLFSWIMREVLRGVNNTPGVQLLNLSYRKKAISTKGVGLFPDRFVARLDKGVQLNVKTVASNILDTLVGKMTADLNNPAIQRVDGSGQKKAPVPPFDRNEIHDFMRNYLRLISIEFTLQPDEDNPVKKANDYLNSLELQASFAPIQPRDYLAAFFEDLLYNEFIRQEFASAGFRSTPEIATSTFRARNIKDYDAAVKDLRQWDGDNSETARLKQEEFIEAVKKIDETRFKLCHKYIAIVHADGDNIGKLFEALALLDKKQLPSDGIPRAIRLTEHIAEFSLAAAAKIKEFDGVPVYAGGDDLLFFAPVSVEDKEEGQWKRRDIFNLINDLDELFIEKVLAGSAVDKDTLKTLKDQNKIPSMSYGVSISHHKYPLGESLKKAQSDLLFGSIKSGSRRNGIAWRLTKHSGAGFGCVLEKGRENGVFAAFNNLKEAKFPAGEKPDTFLASVIYKLESLEGLFVATADKPNYADHFYNILFNNFNESIHRDEIDKQKLSPYLKKVHVLLVACFAENPQPVSEKSGDKTEWVKQTLQVAYAVLRFIHFLDTSDKS